VFLVLTASLGFIGAGSIALGGLVGL